MEGRWPGQGIGSILQQFAMYSCKSFFKYWFHLAMVDRGEQGGEEMFGTGSSSLTETNSVVEWVEGNHLESGV